MSAAKAAVAKTDLNTEQAEAVVKMLTATTMATALVAPAGSGKTHAMTVFADLWHKFTGGRVIGLTTSTNAAKVMESELAKQAPGSNATAYNIAQFLGKIEGSQELRRPVAVHERDILVLDEATQVDTHDFALVQQAARSAGARLDPVGDTQQLGAVGAGGIFRLVAQEVPAAELHEIRRFNQQWERDASVRLREGEIEAVATYDTHGRISGGDEERTYERAVSSWLADHLQGKQVLLLAGSNAEAAELARRVQEKLIKLGAVDPPELPLSDGNHAGRFDLVRARLNTHIDAAGQRLTNRDTLRITGYSGPDVHVERQRLDGTWTRPFVVPRSYLESDAELDYAGNTHVAQGRTVDVGHLLVTPSLSRQSHYVGMTRGREANHAHVVTGNTAPEGAKPYEQATPESVIKAVMQRDDADLSATEQMRISQKWAGGSGHVLNLWGAALRGTIGPEIDALIKARLTPADAARYDREPSKPVLQNLLKAHQMAGHDIRQLIPQITAGPMTGARSVSSVLHGRLTKMNLPLNVDATWSQRTPENAPQLAHELAEALDHRVRELGERQVPDPEPWLARHLGVLSPDASPTLREEYIRRAAVAASYREAAGITDPEQAVSFRSHSTPELDAMRRATFAALEIVDEEAEIRAASRGELEARVLQGQRAMATAPQNVAGDLKLTAQAEANARRQAAQAQVDHDHQAQLDAEALAGVMGADRARLERLQADYDGWSGRTSEPREAAGKAQKELERRGQAEHEPEHDEPEHDQPDEQPDVEQPEVESEADFQARLYRMVYGTDPEPAKPEMETSDTEPETTTEHEPLHDEPHAAQTVRKTEVEEEAEPVQPEPEPEVHEQAPEVEAEPPESPEIAPRREMSADKPKPARDVPEPVELDAEAAGPEATPEYDAQQERQARQEAERDRAACLDAAQLRAEEAAARMQAEREQDAARAEYEATMQPEPEVESEYEMELD